MGLAVVWFILIALLWTGFFVLEGFDFGVGMLHASSAAPTPGGSWLIDTIGPLWDGNEVWLVVAGAAMFAAFPGWYATMFSALYLPLVLLLVALIVRGVSFEYRDKRESLRWRRTWSLLMTVGSLARPAAHRHRPRRPAARPADRRPAGVHGRRARPDQSLQPLRRPHGRGLCVTHGATFLALKVGGDVRDRARTLARRSAR